MTERILQLYVYIYIYICMYVYKQTSSCIESCTCSATLMVSLFSKSPAEGTDFPILELDLGWELPDFASIGMHIYVFPVETVHKTNLI